MTGADRSERRGGSFSRIAAGKVGLLAGLAGAALGGTAVALWAGQGGSTSSSADRTATEQVVRDYLLANPEIIPEAMQRLQDRETGAAIGSNRAAYETPFASAWAGAENGDVTLVEFFDYACGYCRKSNADVERLLREDPKLKVVWREWPVLGPDSEAAAHASLAAAGQGKFRPFFEALFALGRPDADNVAQALRAAGVSGAQVAPETAARELADNQGLAQAVNASGTPTFVVGDRVLQGAVGYEVLKSAIAEARTAG